MTSDPTQRAAQLRDRIVERWTPERAERVHLLFKRRRARRRALGVLSGAALLLCVGLLLLSRVGPRGPGTGAPEQAQLLALPDGSQIHLLAPESAVVTRAASGGGTALELLAGRARFRVAPQRGKRFRVEAGRVSVEVVGTVFTLSRSPTRVEVQVEEGVVRVRAGEAERLLRAGERDDFPSQAPAVVPPPAPAPPPPPVPVGRVTAGTLLEQADQARRARRYAEAADLLGQIVQEHSADERAPLAAFTLGLLYLERLDRPAEAADAFAVARALRSRGLLAEDALAREVEAWARAGQAQRALGSAREYLRLYPHGRRLQEVRRHAALP